MSGGVTEVALVIGASGDIGGAIALECARRGMAVAAHAYRNPERAEALCRAIEEHGGVGMVVVADVTDPEAVESCVRRVRSTLGPVTVLVNSAGIIEYETLDTMTPHSWSHVLATNLNGPLFCCRACVPGMKARGRGCIVNVLSVSAFNGGGPPAYVASKAGLWGLTMSLARELAPFGIRVNAVTPGVVDTSFHDPPTRAVYRAEARKLVPLGRIATPYDVAHAVGYLIEHEYLTGTHLVVAGGAWMA